MIATPIVKESVLNTSVTEAQLKLAISQVLSLPSAYNAPVIVLDFKVGDNGLVTGRFRDAARPRVFSYEIDDDGIAFKPFVPGRLDSFNVDVWESFSEGYTYRIDAVTTKSKSRPKCVKPTAYNCGKSCININKTCKVNPKDANSSMRRKRLKAVVEGFKKANKGVDSDQGTATAPTPKNKSTSKSKKEKVAKNKPETTDLKQVSNKLIGDGTHEGVPKDAEEYRKMMAKNGNDIDKEEAEGIIRSVTSWSDFAGDIRHKQKKGQFSQEAEDLETYIKSSTPYKGEIYRGISFGSEEEAMEWLKGDKDKILDNQSALASWSASLGQAENFAKDVNEELSTSDDEVRQPVVIQSKNKTGASILRFSKYPEEEEVIVSKGARHKVKSITKKGGIIYVETEEV